MADETRFQWISASLSDVGLVRSKNEDACLDRPERGLWAVADGMGGHALGDLASHAVVQALDTMPAAPTLEQLVGVACERLQQANRQLRIEAADRGVDIIGSTVVALLAFGRVCACIWAGDSRLYRYRHGRLQLITRDHSQLEEFKALLRSTGESTAVYPGKNMITRAVGAADSLILDHETINVDDGDMFLLCSDGLSNPLSEQQISSTLVSGSCPYAARALIDLALDNGGRDNVSVIVVRADDLFNSEKTALNPAL